MLMRSCSIRWSSRVVQQDEYILSVLHFSLKLKLVLRHSLACWPTLNPRASNRTNCSGKKYRH